MHDYIFTIEGPRKVPIGPYKFFTVLSMSWPKKGSPVYGVSCHVPPVIKKGAKITDISQKFTNITFLSAFFVYQITQKKKINAKQMVITYY